ncbi:type II toxin-antitoxin system Phd/YefM family antitoxin [Erythrobacter sp. CCH5-A1]|jgi:PHD/YefM family antitoxin component YafN of YafNO toxin-antitoxin module|uniref:type II toxin-antitoxin system Phd/YefM family antitoxin n=1 Tax=Erythrobacter sp. CCH5-A1 TaxID=1768792 RepID=UPI00082BAB94|nr:type II toxin-antitoxin system Phd/YefM family antitoxin [Erythrobacter sp. CCH5-A1]
MSQPYRETVSTTTFSKRVGYYYDEAISRAVGLERHGEVRVVMVPADEYRSLRKLLARALKSESLKDVIEELTAASATYHPDAPDSYEDDAGEPVAPKAAKKRKQPEAAGT